MTKIIQRHDTAANWASANPVLAQGEMGIEDDTRKFKFGDGTTAWADLPYASSEGGGGTGGTSNYNDLTNKPTINTLELKGELALGGALKIERASTDAFYNSARNASNQLTFSKASGFFAASDTSATYIYGASGLVINSDSTITPSSYFMMPYKLGDVIACGRGDANQTYTLALLGYKINGRFKPVVKAIMTSSGSSNTYSPTSFLNTTQIYSTTYYRNETLYTNSTITPDATYKDSSTYPLIATSHQYMSSLVYDESLGLYKLYYKYTNNTFKEYQFDTVMNEELQKVDTVMVLYKQSVTTPDIYTNFEIKDGSTVNGNFLTDMTYPDVIALPSVEVPEVIEHNVLSTGNIPNSYAGLDEKPKINGNELVGDINSTDLNIQRVMTPNGGINIVQNGDWHFFDASYNDTTKQITFNRYNLHTSSNDSASSFDSALNSTSTSASKIGTYVDAEKIIPTCGVITPFYKNVTWKFGYSNYANDNRLVFGNYVDGYFYPKYAICPRHSYSTSASTHFVKINSISADSTTVFSSTNVPITTTQTKKSSTTNPAPVSFITILYSNNTYIFKYTHQNANNNYFYRITATVTNDTEGLNSCTHCWHIPNNASMGYNTFTQLATGDWSSDCFNANMSNTKLNDALILPDSGSNVFTTSISVKTDGVTTKINGAGELEAIAPDVNVATVDTVGTVKPDGTTITITADGTISSTGGAGGSIATTNTAGIVKPDGSTITVSEDGTISAVAPANMITTDNIASDATISAMNNSITALSSAVDSKANIEDMDGEWTSKVLQIASNVALSPTVDNYSLADYLPNDGKVYEVIINATLAGNTSGYSNLILSSQYISSAEIISNARISTSTAQTLSTAFTIPIGIDRSIGAKCGSDSSKNGSYYLKAHAYRKVR